MNPNPESPPGPTGSRTRRPRSDATIPGAAAAVCAVCVPPVAAGAALTVLGRFLPPDAAAVSWSVLATMAAETACIALMARGTGSYLRALLREPALWTRGIRLYPLLLPALAAAAVLGNLAIRAAGLQPPPNELRSLFMRADSLPLIAVLAFAACVFAPLAEEVLFRGFLYGGLRGVAGRLPATILSAACFAVFHQDLGNLAGIFCLGCAFAWLVESTGSLWPAVGLHAVNNTVATAALLLWRTGGGALPQ